MGVNSHLPIHNRFYDFTSWSRTRTTPIDCPWIVMINQLGSDQCTWPWGDCLLSELREWRRQTGRHNGLRRPLDNRQSVSQKNHVIFSRETKRREKKKERTRKRREKSSEKTRAGGFEEAERRIPEFFDPCCCPRVKNADEKQRLADWTETSCGEIGFKTGIPYRL
ncbi:hypothetical protein TNCV_3570011 [Trichonephila clavipes]|nr:hypothetical protein TNCV_3570011 [Trichonephila clavipes]